MISKLKIMAIIICLLMSNYLKSQVFEPEPLQFEHFTTYGATTKSISSFNNSDARFKYNKYVLGWHWAWGKRLSNSFGMNQAHIDDFDDGITSYRNSNLFRDTVGIVMNIHNVKSSALDLYPLNAQCYVYKPTLEIEANQIPKLQNLEIDNSGKIEKYIFGFQTVVGDKSNSNYLQLNLGQFYPNTIIENCWINKGLHTFDGYGTNNIKINHLGSKWRICISVSRGENEDNEKNDVLRITMPYILGNNNNGAIIFWKLPSENQGNNLNIYKDNDPMNSIIGKRQELNVNDYQTTEFIIKKSMLPNDGSTIDIFAEFLTPPKTIGDLFPYENPAFKDCEPNVIGCNNNTIAQFDIKVEYLGACDVKIHNIRVCTPNAYDLFWEQYNGLIKSSIQTTLDEWEQTNPSPNKDYWQKDQIIKRIYMRDEGGPAFWASYRYFNKLVNNIGTIECGPKYPLLYDYYVEPPERWYSYSKSYVGMGCPYIKNSEWKSEENINGTENDNMGFGRGFMHENKAESSHYETYLSQVTFSGLYNRPTPPSIADYGNAGTSFQRVFETYLLDCFWFYGNDDLIFMQKDWWAQFNIDARFYRYKNNNVMNQLHFTEGVRPPTYNEITLFCYTPVILGAKGILLDGELTYDCNDPEHDITIKDKNGRISLRNTINVNDYTNEYLSPFNVSDGKEFINLEELGSDWIDRYSNSFSNIEDHIDWEYKDLSNKGTADLLPRPNKFYIGQKSGRRALFEFSKFIRKNEPTIMQLFPKCRMSKGFYKYYTQAPGLSENFMANYISMDVNNWKTRPVGRINQDGTPLYENKFANTVVDSNFFETSILAHKDNPNISDSLFIGLVNRRCDPIIKTGENQFDFITEPEMEELTNGNPNDMKTNPANLGQTKSVLEWRLLYNKRLGCREITIPFNYKDPENPNRYCLLQVQELLAEGDPGQNAEWWRKQRYENRIDTIIGMDNELAIKFQPGEGKILKVTVLRPETQDGNLDFSNQCKMVSHPVLDNNGNETNNIMYHLTFHKKIGPGPNDYHCYYAASEPISKDDAKENIRWRPFVQLCPSITIGMLTLTNPNTVNPSIIARKDNSNNRLKVYIVYSILAKPEWNCSRIPCQAGEFCPTYFENPIAEEIFTYDNTIQIGRGNNVIVPIVKYDQSINEKFGTPVISATNNYNYYAWSDAICGIGTNYKLSSEITFQNNSDYIRFNSELYNYAVHPSFDSYLEPYQSSNSCPLVWYEFSQVPQPVPIGWQGATYSKREIIYTELFNNQGAIYHSLPPFSQTMDISNNCLKISDNNFENYMPVIQRSWNIPNDGGLSPISYYDQIFWEAKKSGMPATYSIAGKFLRNEVNGFATLSTEKYIMSLNKTNEYSNLIQANTAPGDAVSFDGTDLYPNSSRKNFNNFNFKVEKYSNGTLNNQSLYNLIYPKNNFFDYSVLFTRNPIVNYISEGNNPHLSKNWDYNLNINLKMWRNRRIFESVMTGETDALSNRKLIPNARYFYKDAADIENSEGFVGFVESYDRRFKYLINLPKINDEEIPLKLPYEEITDSVGYTDYIETECDTIFSEWFNVQDMATLKYKSIFADTINANLYVQKQSNNQLIYIPRPGDFETDLCFMVYFLINGQGDNYRLVLFKNDTNLTYEERLYVGNVDVQDTLFAKTKSMHKFIDLSGQETNITDNIGLMVYPNPVGEVLYAAASLPAGLYSERRRQPYRIRYTLSNSIGDISLIQEAAPGDVIQFSTSELPSGAYFLRAEEFTKAQTKLMTTKTIIISH